MSAQEAVFLAANTLALIAWVALCFRPRAVWVLRLAGQWVPMLFALLYFGLIAARFGRSDGDFSSLARVARLFQDPWALLAGWVHYLAFDLLVGVWEARDAAKRQLSRWLLVPCLLLTFMFGPVGWLAYQAARRSKPLHAEQL